MAMRIEAIKAAEISPIDIDDKLAADHVYDFVKTLELAGDDADIRIVSCVDQTSIDEHVAALIIFQYLAAAVGIDFRLQPGDNAVFDKRAEKSHGGLYRLPRYGGHTRKKIFRPWTCL